MSKNVTYTLEFIDDDQAKEFMAWLWAEGHKINYDLGQDRNNEWLKKIRNLITGCQAQLEIQYEEKVIDEIT